MAGYKTMLDFIGKRLWYGLCGMRKRTTCMPRFFCKTGVFLTPAGSVKDRIAKAIVEEAEKKWEAT